MTDEVTTGQEDIFDADNQSADNQEGQPSETPDDLFSDQLAAITREDGTQKYTNVADALTALPAAQTHISTIEKENAELKAALEKQKATEELLRKAGQPSDQQTLTTEQVEEIALRAQTKAQTAQIEEANKAEVNARFKEVFGDSAKSKLAEISASTGLGVDQIQNMAKQSPKAVFKLAGLDPVKAPASKTPYSPNSRDTFTPPTPEPEVKSVMSGANTQQMIDSWNAAGRKISNR